jgi:hypothetical protein
LLDSVETQREVASDFIESDILKGRYVAPLGVIVENHANSAEQIRKAILERNNQLQLDYHLLENV